MTSKRWILIAAVLGSGIVFLDSTVVNVALPRIGRDLPRLFLGVLEELFGHGLCMNAGGHVVVTFIAQHTDNFGSQDLIEDADNRFAVRAIGAGHRTLLHVRTGAAAEFLDVCHECTMVLFDRYGCHLLRLG